MDPRSNSTAMGRKADSSDLSNATNGSPSPPPLRGVHVLVVDDDPSSREAIQLVLERSGSRVTTAATVADALAVLPREVPDVLLSDIEMPEQHGYDLIRQVRALPKDQGGAIPAAALTGNVTAEDRENALRAGFTMHASKPADPAELVRLMTSLAHKMA